MIIRGRPGPGAKAGFEPGPGLQPEPVAARGTGSGVGRTVTVPLDYRDHDSFFKTQCADSDTET